ncbi:MAG TPA: hypothetical protein VMJ11_33940 [Paraburkholderia sp.]|uniref:hypothetical protein n=1 Tax=Paraburkholderia sp. TaxID=1926495 RepID=UPI002C333015|nr:hypothetical protein [Paraburkholderia sp.]HTR11576.1 hypothetical protein [Paraburkholderia sp.]
MCEYRESVINSRMQFTGGEICESKKNYTTLSAWRIKGDEKHRISVVTNAAEISSPDAFDSSSSRLIFLMRDLMSYIKAIRNKPGLDAFTQRTRLSPPPQLILHSC